MDYWRGAVGKSRIGDLDFSDLDLKLIVHL